jgi:hypothetical protein
MKIISALSSCLLFVQLVAIPPAPLQNYCPVVVVNKTGLNANQIYFVAHGNDLNGFPCFLVPDGDGICQFSYPMASGLPSSASSSKLLSQLPIATGTGITHPAYLIYLPINASSRGYFSINTPMYLPTALNPSLGVLGIDDSSVTSLTDPNYYTLYQDFEFGMDSSITNSSTNLFLNLSWVDYFCLPMQLNTYSYPSNNPIVIDENPTVLPAGTPSNINRGTLIQTVNSELTSGQATSSWGNLGIAYYNNPYTDSTPATYIRILAAKNSIDLSTATQFVGAKVTQPFFPSNYASNASTGPTTGISFMQAVYNYYLSSTFYAQIFPRGLSATTYEISSVQSTPMTLQFTAVPSNPLADVTLDLSNLAMDQLLSGSKWPFQPSNVDAAYTDELSKLISALFTIGKWPFTAATSQLNPFVNNNQGFAALSYFQNPPGFSGGPWYNLYDKILHTQMISQGKVPNNPNLGIGYAYDFDDLLNMSGLITGIAIQDPLGNPSQITEASQPYIVISLEDMSGTPIPDISQDTYAYDVTVGPAANGVNVSFTYYDEMNNQQTTNASLTEPTSLGIVDVKPGHPFIVTFNFDGTDYVYHINLLRQIVVPSSVTSTFSAIDQKFQGSFEFAVSNPQTNPQFTITFDSTPPPWPN